MDEASSSISVAVRVRPFTEKEASQLRKLPSNENLFHSDASLCATPVTHSSLVNAHRSSTSGVRKVVRVVDDRILVFDPPESNPVTTFQRQILGPSVKKVKDIRFCFDKVFDEDATQADVYQGAASDLVKTALNGFNSTVFAYGATGCGKTHTISGSTMNPGIVFLLMKDLFDQITAKADEIIAEVSVSYLEIYNETIRDLLTDSEGPSGILNLREVNGRVTVPHLSSHTPRSPEHVIEMIHQGNTNRQTSPTEANAVSSRSHAVLSVNIKHRPRTSDISENHTIATLSVIDLAGSERAAVTKNRGERLLEGANINRSLLALGNCINALCDPRKRGHVPYRDSKLTRLLKHSLGGNCKTVMIVCISPSSQHYDETHNTLQYANRAKEIKTKITRNVVTVDRHVSQYVRVIYELRKELEGLKGGDSSKDSRIKDTARKEIFARTQEVDMAIRNLRMIFQDTSDKVSRASWAKSKLEIFEYASKVFTEWRNRITSSVSPDISSGLLENINNLSSQLATQARELMEIASFGDQARINHDNNVATSRKSMSSKLANSECMEFCMKHFDREIVQMNADLNSHVALGRDRGRMEGFNAQMSLSQAMFQTFEEAMKAYSDEAHHFSEAYKDALSAFSRNSISSPGSSSNPNGASVFANNKASQPHKRSESVAAKSLPTSQPSKIRRSSGENSRSTPRRLSKTYMSKSSPHGMRGMVARAAKKKKSVAWRDERGDGQVLEDFQNRSDISLLSNENSEFSIALSPQISTSQMTSIASTSQSNDNKNETPSVFSMASQPLRPRRQGLASKPTTLASVGEEGTDQENVDLLNENPPKSTFTFDRPPMLEKSNKEIKLHAPLVKAVSNEPLTPRRASAAAAERVRRRTSSIGPLRSAKKSARRHSYLPPLQPQAMPISGTRVSSESSANIQPQQTTSETDTQNYLASRRTSLMSTGAVEKIENSASMTVKRPLPRARRESSIAFSTAQKTSMGFSNNSSFETSRSDTSSDKPLWR